MVSSRLALLAACAALAPQSCGEGLLVGGGGEKDVRLAPAVAITGTTYYVNSATGSDANDGLCADRPFRSIERVNRLRLAPGKPGTACSASAACGASAWTQPARRSPADPSTSAPTAADPLTRGTMGRLWKKAARGQ